MSRAEASLLKSLPKVLLHEHLDGSLRPSTLIELLRARGIAPPADDAAALVAWFDAKAHAGSLVEYLKGFALTVEAMASLPALERVAFEAAEDALEDGVVLAEFRIAPLLFEPFGIDADAAVEALVAGLARSRLASGLIVCAIRHESVAQTERAARLAIRHAGRGVIAFDLAGAEAGHPPAEHASALALCRDAGLPMTLHAGEADEAKRVVEAGRLGARRIGHGVRLAEAPELIDEVRSMGLHLEVCPTSNVHTGAATSIATHPIRALWDAGVSLSYHTDNRLMSCITQSGEAAALASQAGFTRDDLLAMARLAAMASFLPDGMKADAIALIDAAVRTPP